MLKQTQGSNGSKRLPSDRMQGLLAKFFFALGMTAGGLSTLVAYASEVPIQPNARLTVNPATSLLADATTISQEKKLSSGTYLYGQSPQAEQLGQAYMVFEVSQNRVIGAFYMPHSSFDCFHGTVGDNQLALTVIDSYEQTPHPYSVALERQYSNTASQGNPAAATVGLQGYHRINTVSENDQRMLNVCKSDFSDLGQN